jgi:nucleoside phosphorylase
LPFQSLREKNNASEGFKVSLHRNATGSAAPRQEDRMNYFDVLAVMMASATFFGASL